MPEIALQSSNREREAIDIEREVDDMKIAEYMEKEKGGICTYGISGCLRVHMLCGWCAAETGTSHVSEPGYIISERSTVLYL